MNKRLKFNLEEAASYFYSTECTENEQYLLDIILELGKEYNSLVDKYNRLVHANQMLINKTFAVSKPEQFNLMVNLYKKKKQGE